MAREVVVYDPRAGEIRGHKQLRRFVSHNHVLAGRAPGPIETVACTHVRGRAVVELLAHLADDGRNWRGRWQSSPTVPTIGRSCSAPTAANGQSTDGDTSGLRFSSLSRADPGDVVGRYQAALDAGDAEAIVTTFARDGYFREPIGPHSTHRGTAELRSFFAACFSEGGGIGLAALRRDRRRRALRAGVQLRPLGQPRPTAPGGNRRLRARPGRTAGGGPRLRRCRTTRRARPRR